MRSRRHLAVLVTLILASPLVAQLPPDKALESFKVADDLQIELFASEPMFTNPTCIDVDHRGRVWVCESVNYRTRLRNQPLRRKEGDRIVILEDTNGDGKADKETTFYQAPELMAPLGIAVAKDPTSPAYKVYVCQSPDILVFEDADGDGKADGPPKKLLTGFGGIDHDHGVHSVLIGPDMKLYFTVGDSGVNGLQSSDGKGRKWTSNNTDCRAGTVWRCDLDGKNLELIAHNFRNNYECCVDSFGTIFLSDNDDDGNQQTRICYVMPGGNYGYHPRGPGQSHWHEEQPGIVPKILRTGFGSPPGITVYEGSLLPKKYQGHLLHCDAGPRHVRSYRLTPRGAGYDVEREDIVQSTDTWFRPSDVCVAPDSSVFVSDWYDPGVGGHGIGDLKMGRIYRITPKGHKGYTVPKVDVESKDGLLAALGSPNLAVRYMAMAALSAMPPKMRHRQIHRALAATSNSPLRARAFWDLARLFKAGDFSADDLPPPQALLQYLGKATEDKDARLRTQAVRMLADLGLLLRDEPHLPPSLTQFARSDDNPAVRAELLLRTRDWEAARLRPLLLELARKYDGSDRFYLAAIGIAVGTDPKRREILLADFEKHFPEWNDKVADLVWELRPPSVMKTLGKRLSDGKLTAAQRARIVDILAMSDEPSAGPSLLAVLATDAPAEVRSAAFHALRHHLPGKWSGLRASKELEETIAGLLTRPDGRLHALGLIAIAEKSSSLPALIELFKSEKKSPEERLALVQALGALSSAEAARFLAEVVKSGPTPLRPDAITALGIMVQQKPDRPAVAVALTALQAVITGGGDLADRQTATRALAGSQAGSQWLLGQPDLPAELKPEVARLLRNSPYQDVRNQAAKTFPTVVQPGKLDPKKLPSIASLIVRKGDANRGRGILGRTLMGDAQCLKCHTINGIGGQIGPDLSAIGKKASKENLYDSILNPSKAVADQYVNWIIETKAGAALTGLIVEETPTSILLRDANGKDTKLDKGDIETRAKSPVSLMPTDIVSFLTEDELVDLVEYLTTLVTESAPPGK